MLSENANRKKRTEMDIRQMEIDDSSGVYHLGEDLFTSEDIKDFGLDLGYSEVGITTADAFPD